MAPIDIDAEVEKLETKATKLLRDTYAKLTPWQKTQVARHPERPHFKDYVAGLADDFMPWPATARSAMIRRSSAGSRGSMGGG